MKATLTPEQSASLIELGVDASKASESRIIIESSGHHERWESPVPAFTLTDLLELLPKEIWIDGVRTSLQMYQHLAGYWIVSYVAYDGNKLVFQRPLATNKELIDALYSLLVWAIENKHITITPIEYE